MKKSLKNLSPIALTVAIFLIAWLMVAYLVNKELFFPRPDKVFSALSSLVRTSEFWKDLASSFYRVLAAFVFSIAVSYPLVLLTLTSDKIKRAVFLLVEFFRYLPIPVFIPLTILWFGIGDAGKIFIVFLGTFAQMIPMYYDSTLIMQKSFTSFPAALKWRKNEIIKNIIVPGSAPFIWDNSRICFGWAWTYLIIAELLGAENGLGYAIIRAQRYLATDRIFAYVIVIGLIGLLSDRLMVWGKKKLFQWQ